MDSTIVVCGDLVWDTHVVRYPRGLKAYSQPQLQSQLVTTFGGAWYLASAITAACESGPFLAESDRKPEDRTAPARLPFSCVSPANVTLQQLERGAVGVSRACTVWDWNPGTERPGSLVRKGDHFDVKWKKGVPVPGAWRITEFLGCEAASWDGDAPAWPAFGAESTVAALAIDDLGLGFASHPSAWPECLRSSVPPAHVFIKATPPFEGPLWEVLLGKAWAPHVTVVLASSALRDHGALISNGCSWDQTIEDVRAEFERGLLGRRLAGVKRAVVVFKRSGAAVFAGEGESLPFERCVFDPKTLEGAWEGDMAGQTFGVTSVMTAALVVADLMDVAPSSHLPVSRGLEAARELHRCGGGQDQKTPDLAFAIGRSFSGTRETYPETSFRTAYSRDVLDEPVLGKTPEARVVPPAKQTILTDVLGASWPFLRNAAEDIVRLGKDTVLRSVPCVQYGQYFTVDRQEIERLNSIRNLVLDYRSNPKDTRPLSIAVFGAPGSGKSFAIKQLAEALFGAQKDTKEFNLSQMEDLAALHEAFHQVRDVTVKGQLPLVFFDEFDTEGLKWLKDFLAPMQDAQFVSRGKAHPFGKCIFIFAGGTSQTFAEFDKSVGADAVTFKAAKGPDFVSRLRGYVNIKGPNPADDDDAVFVLRRALLLRTFIERYHPHVINRQTNEFRISDEVLGAFLTVGRNETGKGYLHGARSMENIVSLSRLSDSESYGPSELPPAEVIRLHVGEDFLQAAAKPRVADRLHDATERVAQLLHKSWFEEATRQTTATRPDGTVYDGPGCVPGDERRNYTVPKVNPACRQWGELSDAQRQANRRPAALTWTRLAALGYELETLPPDGHSRLAELEPGDALLLARAEHRRWMREKLLDGYCYGPESHDRLLIHPSMVKFDSLSAGDQRLDMSASLAVKDLLAEKRWSLRRVAPK